MHGNIPGPIRRSPSSVVLTAEGFVDFRYVDDAFPPKGKATRSSIGDRLHLIINLALDQVNQKLAGREGKVSEAAPSSQSEGPRYDFSFLLPRFWTGTK